jgi:membrane fusion protein, multidrug efflux system
MPEIRATCPLSLTTLSSTTAFASSPTSQMNELIKLPDAEELKQQTASSRSFWPWAAGVAALALAGAALLGLSYRGSESTAQAAVPPAQVTVSAPLQRDIDTQVGFLGQFSAVDRVELRAQVGGTLTEIRFKDGDIVHKSDLLFVIDPVPYEIRLAQATAQLEKCRRTARAR